MGGLGSPMDPTQKTPLGNESPFVLARCWRSVGGQTKGAAAGTEHKGRVPRVGGCSRCNSRLLRSRCTGFGGKARGPSRGEHISQLFVHAAISQASCHGGVGGSEGPLSRDAFAGGPRAAGGGTARRTTWVALLPSPCFLPEGSGGASCSRPGTARQRRAMAAPDEEQQSPGIRDVLGVYFTAKKCQKSVLFGQGFAGDR